MSEGPEPGAIGAVHKLDFCEECQGWYCEACEGRCSYCAFWDQQESDDARDWQEEPVGEPV